MIHDKTIEDLADPETGPGKLKERSSTLRGEVLDYKRHQKSLIRQYESIIREYKVTLQEYRKNITKMFLVHLFLKIKGKFGGDTK